MMLFGAYHGYIFLNLFLYLYHTSDLQQYSYITPDINVKGWRTYCLVRQPLSFIDLHDVLSGNEA